MFTNEKFEINWTHLHLQTRELLGSVNVVSFNREINLSEGLESKFQWFWRGANGPSFTVPYIQVRHYYNRQLKLRD